MPEIEKPSVSKQTRNQGKIARHCVCLFANVSIDACMHMCAFGVINGQTLVDVGYFYVDHPYFHTKDWRQAIHTQFSLHFRCNSFFLHS